MKCELIRSVFLPDFPSGSSISFYRDKLYLIGDDAREILVLDRQYKQLSTIPLFDYPQKRIPKPIKPDLETSTIITLDGSDFLFVLGSGSFENRTMGMLIPLEEKSRSTIVTVDFGTFLERVKKHQVNEINIEGSTTIGDNFVLSNRANTTNKVNKLVVTDHLFWKSPNVRLSVVDLVLPFESNDIVGVSELSYLPSRDTLLLALSTELTSNAYDDGAIGDSYLGWVNDITKKLGGTALSLNDVINLSECDKAFGGEKIEGLCVESSADDVVIAHLVSDDDKGHSKLFKVKLSF